MLRMIPFIIGGLFTLLTSLSLTADNGYLQCFPSMNPNPMAMLEAMPDTVETTIDEAISFNVLENDIGEGLYVNSTVQPSHGSLSWKLNGDFTYMPDENYVGPDIIAYQIRDAEGNQESGNVFITVKGSADLPLQMSILQECENSDNTGVYQVTIQTFGGEPPYIVDFMYGNDLANLDVYTHLADEYEFLFWVVDLNDGYAIIVRDEANNVVVENHLLEIFCHEDVVNTCVLETDFNLTPITTCNEGEKTIEVVASGGSGEYTYYGQFLEENGDYVIVEDSEGCQNILFYDEIPPYACPKANDDVVNGAYNAPFHLKPLLNDEGEGLYISHIGGLSNGTLQWRPDDFLAYFPDEDFTGIDTIDYEITDVAGNTSSAKILAVVPENDEVEIFWERDCSRAEQEGIFEINFTVAGGKPPYIIEGDLTTMDYRGDEILNFMISDGDDFTITAIDNEGETTTIQKELIPCTFLSPPISEYTIHISCVEGEDYGILTAIDYEGQPISSFQGNENGDTIPNGNTYFLNEFFTDAEGNGLIIEETVYCPPIAHDDLYYNHPSYLQFPLTFNPLLNDNGHGLRLVELENPNYGTLEWWQADGTINYRPPSDFQGVETFDYTLEDIGGNRTQATIKIVVAHPTELKITYQRDCSDVIENGAENYTVNAFVSGGFPPYQVQVNEGEFFEIAENGGEFSFEVLNGEGFTIYAEDAGFVTHEAMVEELELAACSELVVEVDRDCSTYCEGYYYLHVAIFSGTSPFIISGTINDTLETIGFVSTTNPLQNDEPYEIYVTDNAGSEFSEVVEGETPCPIFGSCCETLLLETIDDIATCLCDGSMIFHFQVLSDTTSITDVNGYWVDDINGEDIEVGDTISHTAYLEFYEVYTENGCYNIMIGDEIGLSGNVSDFCTSQSLEAIDDFASTNPGEDVTLNLLQNDTGTNLEIVGILVAPSCGTIIHIDPETGETVYVADPNTSCESDTFVYEGVDECGNLVQATVTITIIQPPAELIVEVGTSCKDFCSDKPYVVNVFVIGGQAPYNISGSIDTVLETSGFVLGNVENDADYEIRVIDNLGNEFYKTGKQDVCIPIGDCSGTIEIENITDIFDCTCDGSIIFSFDKLSDGYDICGIQAYLFNDITSEFIELGDTIPPNSDFELRYIYTENNYYCIEYNGNPISNLTGPFCTSETYTLEAQDDFAATFYGESTTINVLQNDSGTNLQINAITVSPVCGEILEINSATGEIVYTADANTSCSFDTFVYQAIDECGNLVEATVTVAITTYQPSFWVEAERDCTDASENGFYTLIISIFGDNVPFVISGSIDTILNQEGVFTLQIEDGTPYEIRVIDSTDNEFYEIGGEVSCCELAFIDIALNESQSQTITCSEENIILNIEGSESNTYNWYLDGAATIPATPPTGQVWVNDEKVGPRVIYLVATYGSLCVSDTIPFVTYAYEQISVTDLDIEIDVNCQQYQVRFDIIGGNGVYTVNGLAINTPSEYVSDWMLIDEDYSFIIDDSPLIPNCESITISGSASNFECLPIARDDCVAVEKGEGANIDVLDNDTGKDIQLWGIFPIPSCGEIMEAIPETGRITYLSDPFSDCEEDSFGYEIRDADGNTDQATIRVLHVEDKDELFVKVETDCSEQYTQGLIEVSVWVLGGIPPFSISGTINGTLDDFGQISTTLVAGLDYEIQVTDSEGNEFSKVDNHPCCTQYEIIPILDCLIEGPDTLAILTYEILDENGLPASPPISGNPQNDTLSNGEIYQLSTSGSVECEAAIVIDTIDCNFIPISNIEHPIPNIQLYPNPNNGNFTLSLQLKQMENIEIEVVDILGRAKIRRHSQSSATFEQQLNLNLPSGLYFLQVSGENWRWIEKVIVR